MLACDPSSESWLESRYNTVVTRRRVIVELRFTCSDMQTLRAHSSVSADFSFDRYLNLEIFSPDRVLSAHPLPFITTPQSMPFLELRTRFRPI